MLEGIPTITVAFEYLDGLELTLRPAVADLNPLFAAAEVAYLQPLTLAAQLPEDHPRALTEERSRLAMAKCLAIGCIAGAVAPRGALEELENYTPAEWERWLLADPETQGQIVSLVLVRTNFVEEDENVRAALETLGQQVAHEIVEGAR